MDFMKHLQKKYSKLLVFINLKFIKFTLCKSFKNSMYFEIYRISSLTFFLKNSLTLPPFWDYYYYYYLNEFDLLFIISSFFLIPFKFN